MSPQPQTAKRHRLHGDERRQAIIDAAHSLFISKGYADVSVDWYSGFEVQSPQPASIGQHLAGYGERQTG